MRKHIPIRLQDLRKTSERQKMFKTVIATYNSVAIVFMQFGLLQHAFVVLQRAVTTDISMFFEGEYQDRS